MTYNDQNVFAKILRKEIPCKIIAENDFALSFFDAYPKAPIHGLVIPKGKYLDSFDFYRNATHEEIIGFSEIIQLSLEKLDLPGSGYRLISNQGLNGGQEVPHFHVHILAGKSLGPMIN
jgi:histidine triad (HIT) family protein